MNESLLSQIEETFGKLSISDQKWVAERLAQRVRENTLNGESDLESQLALMAADPEIQSELQSIEREFSHAEADGLETT